VPQLSRTQVLVYGAVAVALLLVGARAIRGEGGGGSYSSSSYSDSGSYSGSDSYSRSGGEEGESGSEEGGESSEFTVSGQGSDLVVDVTGAVADPGVYRMPAGSRVNDAVKRAGGASGKAELEAVNLAARLADGQQVVIPERVAGGGAAGTSAAAVGAGAAGEEGPISLGTATVAELDTIDGIGPVTAQDIVEFREAHGGLSSVEQLDQVSGIGPATMAALRERLQP
jgi:competence protein ComEA